jgi:hypothetical protein
LPGSIVKTLREVAEHFGVSYDTVRKEWRQRGMPGRPGHYDLAEIAAWKRLRLREREDLASDELEEDEGQQTDVKMLRRKRAAEARIKEAEARKKEFDELVRKGLMIDRESVQHLFSSVILTAKDRFEKLPERLMPLFPKQQRVELVEEVRKQVSLILTEMADWRPDESKEVS